MRSELAKIEIDLYLYKIQINFTKQIKEHCIASVCVYF